MKSVGLLSCVVASCLLATTVAYAEAPVIDESQNLAANNSDIYQEPVIKDDNPQGEAQDNYMQKAVPPSDIQAEVSQDFSYAESKSSDSALLLSKLNAMQKEVQQLRGQLEVQSHELKSLQLQSQTFYKDLDNRIASLSNNKLAGSSKPQPATPSAVNDLTTEPTKSIPAEHPVSHPAGGLSSIDEQAAYAAAYDKLKNKQFDESIMAMKNFIQQYPNSDNAVNAHYWLGELYLLKHQSSLAKDEFTLVLHQYPNSLKTDAAMLKLGYAYADMNNYQKAKELLLKVQKRFPGSTTAKLAAHRLNIMKQSGKL